MTMAGEATKSSFTPADGMALLGEAIVFLEKAEGAMRQEQFVLAKAWIEYAMEVLEEQDVISELASREVNEAKRSAAP